jgi:heat shock protein HslJ
MRYLLPAALFLLLLASCASRQPNTSGQQSPFDSAADREELVKHSWTVTTLYGQDLTAPADRDLPYLTFTEDGKVQGHTGCNPINGTYTLEEGLRIRFEGLASGLAFCEDVAYESDFLEVLNATDNYTLNNGSLSLNKARMAPMAVLRAR